MTVQSQLLPPETISNLNKCLEALANSYFQQYKVITVYSNEINLYQLSVKGLLSFVHIDKNFLQVYKNNYAYTVDAYIMDFSSLDEIKESLEKLSDSQNLDQDQKSIFIARFNTPIENIIEILWRFYILNFIVITKDFKIYNWFPFDNSCGNLSNVKLVGSCGSFEGNLYPVKVGRTFNNCPLKVRTAVWPPFVSEPVRKVEYTSNDYEFDGGLDITLMDAIAGKLEFKPVYSMSQAENEWNEDFVDDDDNNNFHLLYARKVDIIINSAINTMNRLKYFYTTPYYYFDSDGFCVPVAKKIPQYIKWIDALYIYSYLFICLVFVAPIMHLITSNGEDRRIRFIETVQDCLSILCGLSANNIPKSTKGRLFLLLWLIFTFLMNMFYQTQLISIMYKPMFEKQVANEKDLVDSKLRLLFLDHYKRYFVNRTTPTGLEIYNRIEHCDDIDVCLKNVTVDRTAAVCIQLTFINYRLNRYFDENGKLQLYCFKDSVNSSPLIILMNRNFYLLQRITFFMQACRDCGLMDKWSKDLFGNVRETVSDEIVYKPMKLSDLRVIFYFYLFGIGVSAAAFLVELVQWKRLTSL